MKGMNMMYTYEWKIGGMIMSSIGILALIIQKLTDFTIISKLNSAQHFNLILWFTIFGLVTMAFSKEKREDERVQQIRAKSFMRVFLLIMACTLAFAFTVTIVPSKDPDVANGITLTRDEVIEAARFMMFYPAVCIVMYLVLFHVGLYFDNTWDYEEQTWTIKGLWQNKRYRLAYVIGGIIIIELIYLLIS